MLNYVKAKTAKQLGNCAQSRYNVVYKYKIHVKQGFRLLNTIYNNNKVGNSRDILFQCQV
jgi:hypothetical protein